MNIKLTQNSLRLRLELLEAKKLLENHELIERFPTSEEGLDVYVSSDKRQQLSVEYGPHSLRFFVPKDVLANVVNQALNTASKKTLLIEGAAAWGQAEIRVQFEIDYFSAQAPKPKKSNEI